MIVTVVNGAVGGVNCQPYIADPLTNLIFVMYPGDPYPAIDQSFVPITGAVRPGLHCGGDCPCQA